MPQRCDCCTAIWRGAAATATGGTRPGPGPVHPQHRVLPALRLAAGRGLRPGQPRPGPCAMRGSSRGGGGLGPGAHAGPPHGRPLAGGLRPVPLRVYRGIVRRARPRQGAGHRERGAIPQDRRPPTPRLHADDHWPSWAVPAGRRSPRSSPAPPRQPRASPATRWPHWRVSRSPLAYRTGQGAGIGARTAPFGSMVFKTGGRRAAQIRSGS